MLQVIKDCFTERDGVSWCWARIASAPALGAMIYKFTMASPPDYANFAGGFAAVMAAIAFKNMSERDRVQ